MKRPSAAGANGKYFTGGPVSKVAHKGFARVAEQALFGLGDQAMTPASGL